MAQSTPLLHLTGLRAIAAYAVFIAHAKNVYIPEYLPTISIAYLAYFGMTLFFVLSGFVIYYNYAKIFSEMKLLRASLYFFIARFSRLYPLYILFVCIFLPQITDNDVLFSYITLTQAWNFKYDFAFNQAWSISTECFFYLSFVLLVPLINKIDSLKWILLVFFITILIACMSLYFYKSNQYYLATLTISHLKGSGDVQGWLEYYSPYPHIFSFVLGCFSAKLYMSTNKYVISYKEMLLGQSIIVGSVLGLITLLIFFSTNRVSSIFLVFLARNFIYAPCIAILLFSLSRYKGFICNQLSKTSIVFLGEISYSVYIIQVEIFSIVVNHTFFSAILAIVLCTVFAYGAYLMIEVPGKRLIRRITNYVSEKLQESNQHVYQMQ